jgi:hypothetical protein
MEYFERDNQTTISGAWSDCAARKMFLRNAISPDYDGLSVLAALRCSYDITEAYELTDMLGGVDKVD